MLSHILVLAFAIFRAVFAANSLIVPGGVWTDTDGNKINAHGGQVFQRPGTFYWIGYALNGTTSIVPPPGLLAYSTNAILTNNTKTPEYSSTDLLNWKNLGFVSTVTSMWRPKYAKPNNDYWVRPSHVSYLVPLHSRHV